MSYRILSSNVILGGANVPDYSLVATSDGVMQIERLDGNAAILSVDGNIECDHVTLTSLTPEHRVLTTDPTGRFITTDFDIDGLGNATALTTGVLPSDRLQGSYTLDNLTASGSVTAGSFIANIDAANLTSGIIPAGRFLGGSYTFGNLVLSNTLTASTLNANISADDVVRGTLHPDRLSGTYAFDGLSLTGNLDAAWVHANLDANSLVSGVLDANRLQGSYTFDTLSISNGMTVANALIIPALDDARVLVSNATGHVVSSNITTDELAYVSGVVSPIQTQINELANGNITGSNITNLDATNITLGILPAGRLSGNYGFTQLTLTDGLTADSVSANLDASQLTRGTVPSERLQGSYTVTDLTASGTVTAANVSGNLDASQLTSGVVPSARLLGGAYTFDSLQLTGNLSADSLHAQIDAGSIVRGVLDHARVDLDGLQTNIIPATEGLTLGTSINVWDSVHATTVHANVMHLGNAILYNGNTVVVDLEQTDRHVIPTSSTYTIGTVDSPWNHVYASNIIAAGNVVLAGSLLKDDLTPYLDLSNVETDIVPVSGGLSIGTEGRGWANIVTTNAFIDTLAVSGNVTTPLVPSTSGLDLGSMTQSWANVYANNLHGNLDAADIYGELDASIVFTGGSIDNFVLKVPSGNVAQPGLRFVDDDQTGLYLAATGNLGLSCANTQVVTVDASAMTLAANVVPSVDASYDLGSAARAWNDVYLANALLAGPVSIVDGAVGGVHDLTCSGTVSAANVDATGIVSASTFVGNLDAGSLVSGTIESGRVAGDYSVNTLTITGHASIAGSATIQPAGHLVPQANLTYDLGSAGSVWRDLYLAGSTIHLGNATIQETGGDVVVSKLVVNGSVTADGLTPPLAITAVDVTDSSWNVVDDTAVSSSSGGYIVIRGVGFAPGSLVQLSGGVNASSTSYVSSTVLRCVVPARSNGSYSVTVIRGDTVSATLPSAITFSDAVTWITGSNLGNIYENTEFTIQIRATSDSVVTYANVDALPPQTTLDPVSGNLSGNITTVTDSTLYSFDVRATDQELQDAILTCLLYFIALTLSSVQLTDVSWSNITQTALDSNSTGYLVVSGQALDQTDDVLIGGTSATSFTKVGSTALRVAAPSKPRGTYDVSVQYGSQTKTLVDGVTYSDVPVWTNIPVVATNEIKLVPSDSEAGAYFGSSCSVSADGSRVVVGAFADDATGGTDSGGAYVFIRSGTTWTQETKIIPSDSEASAFFGLSCSVSADGSRVVVGAFRDDATGGYDSGAAYIFQNTYAGYKESWP